LFFPSFSEKKFAKLQKCRHKKLKKKISLFSKEKKRKEKKRKESRGPDVVLKKTMSHHASAGHGIDQSEQSSISPTSGPRI
jgi:hypothetical protein